MRFNILKISFTVLKFSSSFTEQVVNENKYYKFITLWLKKGEESCLSVKPNMFALLSRFAYTTTVLIFSVGALKSS